jgi:hypothetical protein
LLFYTDDVGAYGQENDSSILNSSSLGKEFTFEHLNIPIERKMVNSDIIVPFYLVGDKAFPLINLMKPYHRRVLDFAKIIFNYRLLRERRTVECTFGILVKKMGIFGKAVETAVDLAEASMKSACILPSFTKKE